MRVFVVNTGRCGSATFYQACRHITNRTVGHETFVREKYSEYPNDHIEISARIAIEIGTLIKRYPKSTWIHLIRERESCIKSLAKNGKDPLWNFIQTWKKNFKDWSLLEIAAWYYDTVNELIEHSIKPEDHMTVHLDQMKKGDWADFWDFVCAEGDFEPSLKEWDKKYNTTENRGKYNYSN